MITFLISLVVLIIGFPVYSRIIDKVFGTDDRKTPAVEHPDGVDYTPMPMWKLFLVQLLNIAGLGPIFGALAGACWGSRVYLWIVFGTILGGGVHDFMSGMLSARHDGASISEVVGIYLGKGMLQVMRVFSVILLILVGTNFAKNPASLLALLTPEKLNANFWLAVIIVYYFIATFLPIDKLIGKLYPVFGGCLIVMAAGLLGVMLIDPSYRAAMPELSDYIGANGIGHPSGTPIWAQMFVSVACGAISGFHATQSPMIARCITSEKQGRPVFYGAMFAEGVIALIWAAAGVTFYGSVGSLSTALAGGSSAVVNEICSTMMGKVGGLLAILGVIACPITSGDTAFRSARLTLADWLNIDQSKAGNRLLLTVPILAIGVFLTQWGDFATLWKYFSWSNQTLAMIVLWTGAVYLRRNGFPPAACVMCAAPAAFMSAVSVTYFFQAAECLNLPTSVAYPVGIVTALVFTAIFLFREVRGKDVRIDAK